MLMIFAGTCLIRLNVTDTPKPYAALATVKMSTAAYSLLGSCEGQWPVCHNERDRGCSLNGQITVVAVIHWY